MNTVLLILGVLGLGAVIIAAYVFTVAARNYVSEHKHHETERSERPAAPITRSNKDRRQTTNVLPFPITVNGILVAEERRWLPDRRMVAAG